MPKSYINLFIVMMIIILSLPASSSTRSGESPLVLPVPGLVKGFVQFNGFNLTVCDGSAGECLDLLAQCGEYTYKRITIDLVDDKSKYFADIPGDDPDTPEKKEGCETGESITFTIKGETPEQTLIVWDEGMDLDNHDLAFGSPSKVFLPMIRR